MDMHSEKETLYSRTDIALDGMLITINLKKFPLKKFKNSKNSNFSNLKNQKTYQEFFEISGNLRSFQEFYKYFRNFRMFIKISEVLEIGGVSRSSCNFSKPPRFLRVLGMFKKF
jgi:hypothetical protein